MIGTREGAGEFYGQLHDVVMGPVPCTQCGAWVEVCRAGCVLALGEGVRHDCEPFVAATAQAAREVRAWARAASLPATPEPARPAWLTARLAIAALLIAVFVVLALGRWQAGLL